MRPFCKGAMTDSNPQAATLAQHQITHSIQAHTSDVKAICSAVIDDHEVVFSVGRDGKGVALVRLPSPHGPVVWKKGLVFDAGPRFANSVCFVPASVEERQKDCLLIGSLDGLIRSYDLPSNFISNATSQHDISLTPTAPLEPTQIIQEHHDNVTSLRFSRSLLISGSWDATARSFRRDVKGRWKLVHILKGHQSAVWGVEIVDDRPGQEKYLTASADLFVRLFEGEEIKVIWAGHRDVVRAVKLLPRRNAEDEQLFVSTSNDPALLINSLSPSRRPPGNPTNGGEPIATLTGHTSIVYDVALSPGHPSRFVTASEDGTARLWDWTITEDPLLETIQHPSYVGSVWCTIVLPLSQEIVTGGSDGVVRVFSKAHQSQDDESEAVQLGSDKVGPMTRREIEQYAQHVQESNASSRRAEVLVSSQRGPDQPQAELLLETAEEATSSSRKMPHPVTGILYDSLLPVDISDDIEPILLGVNKGDDPSAVATRFIAEHNLPQTYHGEIVDFINMIGPK